MDMDVDTGLETKVLGGDAMGEFMTAFEAFKDANDERLDQIEQRMSADVPAKHAKIKKQLSKLIHVPFKFEFGGSQVIFHEVEEDYSAHDKVRDKQQIEAFRELDADAPGAN